MNNITKLKIAFIATGTFLNDDYPNPSHGGPTQIMNMAREMVNRGHSVFIVKRGKTSEVEQHEGIKFINVNIPIPDKSFFRILNPLFFSYLTTRKLKKIKPDVIYLRSRFSAFFPSKLDISSIYTLYSPDACDFYKDWSIKNKKRHLLLFYFKRFIEEKVMYNVTRIIVFHNEAKEYLIKKGFNNVLVIPLGINLEEIPKNSKKENFILYAGRLDWNKSVDVLLEAFSQFTLDSSLSLKLAGSGEEKPRLKKLIENKKLEDRVEFLGWIDRRKLLKYMSKAKVFVLPTQIENFPNVILEAMACYTPVIASDTMGSRAIIKDGFNGFIFNNGDAKDLAKNMEILLLDDGLRKEITENARKSVKEKYNIKKITDDYLDAYKNLR